MEEICDSLKTSVSNAHVAETSSSNTTYIIIGAVFILIITFLIVFYRREVKRQSEMRKTNIDKTDIGKTDMNELLNGMFKAQPLYEKLIKQVHPDRFVAEEKKMSAANDIFQRISENKTNYKVLQELQKEAEEKLNIKI